jgi:hypothetical protein
MFAKRLLVATLSAAFVLSLCVPAGSFVAANESMYTNLTKCKTIKVATEPADGNTQMCPGIAGYKLQVEEGDLRMNIQVVDPSGKKHSLDMWSVVSSAFSQLGEKAEWRITRKNGKVTPVALIVRYIANENSEKPEQKTSYLAVAKITPGQICITDKIKQSAKMNEEARRAADEAAGKQCLSAP